MAARDTDRYRQAAQNRRARRDYEIEDRLEAGLVLAGSEVKSLRAGQASLQDSWAGAKDGELWLFNSYIAEYPPARQRNHEPYRPRKLLVSRRERDRLVAAAQRDGYTLVPLAIYFNDRGVAKLTLGVGKARRRRDRREVEKKRDWDRQKGRLLRENR